MTSVIPAYPLQWPTGWARTPHERRTTARFGRASRARAGGGWDIGRPLTIAEAVDRLRAELARIAADVDDVVISTNLKLRLDGLPKSGQAEPGDPGAAVYWRAAAGATRCMAIDRYDRVADNLAAIAATLDAMRAIERHGGAAILDRAFTGFAALPAPDASEHWSDVLGVPRNASRTEIDAAYFRRRSLCHPDRGGDAQAFDRVQKAHVAALKDLHHA